MLPGQRFRSEAKRHLIGGATRSTTSSAGSCDLLSWVAGGGCLFTCEVAVFAGRNKHHFEGLLGYFCWYVGGEAFLVPAEIDRMGPCGLIDLSSYLCSSDGLVSQESDPNSFRTRTCPFSLFVVFHQTTPFDDASTFV